MLDVRRLIMLRAVAAEGSIAAAARRLQYTRSAVSQQLSALEAEAGTPLVERAGNRITLTPAGRNLVEHTERIVVELRAAEASLAGATAVTGLLRVGIPFREGPQIMSRALTEVRRRFPDMEIRLAAVSYPQAERAADWEFTFYEDGQLTHVLNRNILVNSHRAYALYWSTAATRWTSSYHLFRVFAATFRPADAVRGS